jgi:hypothetical protein
MTPQELFEIEQRIAQLPPGEQLRLIERLIGRLRSAYFTDHEALQRNLREMASDPDIQRELNAFRETSEHATG